MIPVYCSCCAGGLSHDCRRCNWASALELVAQLMRGKFELDVSERRAGLETQALEETKLDSSRAGVFGLPRSFDAVSRVKIVGLCTRRALSWLGA